MATNNYRGYGGKFAGTGDNNVAFASPDENRSILAAYIAKESKDKGQIATKAANNWSFTPIKTDKNWIFALKLHQVKKQQNSSKRMRSIR